MGSPVAEVAQLAANGHRHPATASHTRPRDTQSNGTSSHVCHHTATPQNRLTVKQVYEDCGPTFRTRDIDAIAPFGGHAG